MHFRIKHSRDLSLWHPWFAWLPTVVETNGQLECIWWEWIERRIECGYADDSYHYRLPASV